MNQSRHTPGGQILLRAEAAGGVLELIHSRDREILPRKKKVWISLAFSAEISNHFHPNRIFFFGGVVGWGGGGALESFIEC